MAARPVRSRAGLAVIVSALAACLTATPAAPADFYAGKTIDFLIGGGGGGGYDIYCPLLPRPLFPLFPRSPALVIQKPPGARHGRGAPLPFCVAPHGRS